MYGTPRFFYFYFKMELLKTFPNLPVIDEHVIILANVDIDDSDSRSDINSLNGSMEENQCVEEQDHSESTNTE